MRRRDFSAVTVTEKLTAVLLAAILVCACFLPLIACGVRDEEEDRPAAPEVELRIVKMYGLPEEPHPAPAEPPSPEGEGIDLSGYSFEIDALARTMWGEARGIPSKAEIAAVAWCVLNRVDSELPYMPDTILGVIEQEYQFTGYSVCNPVTEELKALAEDVLTRWIREKQGCEDVGRVLPKEYMWFWGDTERNYFQKEYKGTENWDWSLPDPYERGAE